MTAQIITAWIVSVLCAVLGSVGLFTFIQFLIQRKDKKNDLLGKILKKQDKAERDQCRTQLLVLIADYADSTSEIMQLAEHYFKDLEGDWYMSSIFADYLTKSGQAVPAWFTPK